MADASAGGVERVEVPHDLDGTRIDIAAARLFPAWSRGRLQAWIKDGRLSRNGDAAVRVRESVAVGDVLALDVPAQSGAVADAAQAIPLHVLYADDAIAIIDKPAGLIVHPGAGAPDGTLQNALLHRFPQTAQLPRAGIVHRLDKDTSGLMVVALDLRAHHRLVADLAARRIRREYEALVNGVPTAGGTIDAPIGRDPRNRLRMAVVPDGRRAVTHYRVLERYAHHALLRLRLETGRTHQIRVHLAQAHHAVVGDAPYGGRTPRGAGLSIALREQLLAFPRQALHARELALRHPLTGEEQVFESPLADDIATLRDALRVEAGAK